MSRMVIARATVRLSGMEVGGGRRLGVCGASEQGTGGEAEGSREGGRQVEATLRSLAEKLVSPKAKAGGHQTRRKAFLVFLPLNVQLWTLSHINTPGGMVS